MARTNPELARKAFAAFNESGTEAMLEYLREDFVMTTPAEVAAEPGVYRGHDGVREYWDSFFEVMEVIRPEPVRFHESGDWLLIELEVYVRGKGSGVSAEQMAYAAMRVEDGKAAELTFFQTLDDGLEAIGATQS